MCGKEVIIMYVEMTPNAVYQYYCEFDIVRYESNIFVQNKFPDVLINIITF